MLQCFASQLQQQHLFKSHYFMPFQYYVKTTRVQILNKLGEAKCCKEYLRVQAEHCLVV